MPIRERVAVPIALAAGWLLLAAMPPAALSAHPLGSAMARGVVALFALAILVETMRAIPRDERSSLTRAPAVLLVAALTLVLGALLAWAGGAVVIEAPSQGSATLHAGASFGPLAVWPSVEVAAPAAGLFATLSVGWLLAWGPLAIVGAVGIALALVRAQRAGAAGAACTLALAAPACPACLAPAASALAVLGAPGPAAAMGSGLGAALLAVGAPILALALLARGARPRLDPPRAVISRTSVAAGFLAPLVAAPLIGSQLALLSPDGASSTYLEIRSLFVVVTLVAALLFLPVVILIVYYPWRYRDRGDDAAPTARPLSRRARRWLIATYTIVPGVLILGLGVMSVQVLGVIEEAPDGTLHVNVTAEQWNWTFTTPDGVSSDNVLRVPAGEVVILHVQSVDVVHSLYVPELGVRIDALPHHENTFWFRALRAGEYDAVCAEFCGRGHTNMRARIIAE